MNAHEKKNLKKHDNSKQTIHTVQQVVIILAGLERDFFKNNLLQGNL